MEPGNISGRADAMIIGHRDDLTARTHSSTRHYPNCGLATRPGIVRGVYGSDPPRRYQIDGAGQDQDGRVFQVGRSRQGQSGESSFYPSIALATVHEWTDREMKRCQS